MLVTSPSLDKAVICSSHYHVMCLILFSKPTCSCFSKFKVTVQAVKRSRNSYERGCHREERSKQCFVSGWSVNRQHEDMMAGEEDTLDLSCRAHTFPATFCIRPMCVNRTLGVWKSRGLSPRSPSNRLWLSEAGAFLQFVLTSLLNHLHYLTVFPQRELQLSLSLSWIKACTLRNNSKRLYPVRKGRNTVGT